MLGNMASAPEVIVDESAPKTTSLNCISLSEPEITKSVSLLKQVPPLLMDLVLTFVYRGEKGTCFVMFLIKRVFYSPKINNLSFFSNLLSI